jgi:hypothetical protein
LSCELANRRNSPYYFVIAIVFELRYLHDGARDNVLKQEHLPPWGLTIEPAVVEMEDAVEAGIVA